jgi:hypothetical protein
MSSDYTSQLACAAVDSSAKKGSVLGLLQVGLERKCGCKKETAVANRNCANLKWVGGRCRCNGALLTTHKARSGLIPRALFKRFFAVYYDYVVLLINICTYHSIAIGSEGA